MGYGVKKWANVSNKHVQMVVDQWKAEGLSTATLKEYLSGVRLAVRFYGGKIAQTNIAFGIENRVYISNADKAVPDSLYVYTIRKMENSNDRHERIIASQLKLQRSLGLRKEESFKFQPSKALLADNRLIIQDGTKGGRERIVFQMTQKALKAIENHKQFIDGRSSIPKTMTERQWERLYYRVLSKYNFTKKLCGYSGHGLRHAYAQEQYKKITGFKPPVKFSSREEFISNAKTVGGERWTDKDRSARQILMAQCNGQQKTDT